jgi:hypothetical protein
LKSHILQDCDLGVRDNGFTRNEPENFRLAPENRPLWVGKMSPHIASAGDLHMPDFRTWNVAASLSEFPRRIKRAFHQNLLCMKIGDP